MADGPDINGLRRFARGSDRRLTPFFVGREKEIESIQLRVADVAEYHQKKIDEASGVQQATQAAVEAVRGYRMAQARGGADASTKGDLMLIAGAPGAGKTALADKVGQMWSRDRTAHHLVVPLDALASEATLARELGEQLPTGVAEVVMSVLRLSASVQFGEAGIGVDAGSPREAKTALPKLTKPVVLFVDEIQELRPQEQRGVASMLKDLHLGTRGAPIVPIVAGLANSEDILARAGISRTSMGAVHILGALQEGEAAESVRRFLRTFRVAGDPADWPAAVERWSSKWPMHVDNTLRALAGILADCGGDLDRVDRREVKSEAMALRADYYRKRAGGIFRKSRELLGRVAKRIDKGEAEGTCIRIVREEHEKGKREEGWLPSGTTTDEFVETMIKTGLLQPTEDDPDALACPIPCMRSWCMAVAGGILHTAALSGNIESVATRIGQGDPVNGRDAAARTPLHLAASEGWPPVVSMLLNNGADPGLLDEEGRTPLECAEDAETRAAFAKRMETSPAADAAPGI